MKKIVKITLIGMISLFILLIILDVNGLLLMKENRYSMDLNSGKKKSEFIVLGIIVDEEISYYKAIRYFPESSKEDWKLYAHNGGGVSGFISNCHYGKANATLTMLPSVWEHGYYTENEKREHVAILVGFWKVKKFREADDYLNSLWEWR